MDSSSEPAIQILESLASASLRLRSFGYQVYLKNSLKTWASTAAFGASRTINHGNSSFETYSRGLPIGVYVTLHDGRSVGWGFTLIWNPTRWTVSADIELQTPDDSITIREFPDRVSHTLDECIAHIEQVTTELVASGDVLSDARITGNLDPA